MGHSPSPFTRHPSPFTLHPPLVTLHPSPVTLHPSPFTLHSSPPTRHPSPFTLQHIEHFVTCAHGVIVGLARRGFFVAVFAVIARENAEPRAVVMVHEMFPTVVPDAFVPF